VLSLDDKLRKTFGDVVINKALSQLQQVSRLPRFISEYLVMRICGENPSEQDLARLSEFVRQHYPEPKDKDKILHDIMMKGSVKLMDEFKVETDIRLGTHLVVIPSLNVRDAGIMNSIVEEYEGLLGSGMWGLATLNYSKRPEEETLTPIIVAQFIPYQTPHIDFQEFCIKRQEFGIDEWIDVLINTIGVNPDQYDEQSKIVFLSRLASLVETNCNLMELGPRATGKTYFYRNTSFYTRIISGGRVSPAVLFYNIATRREGEIAVRDSLIFDEVAKVSFINPDEMMGKMKDYMVDGFFERGPKRAQSTCSLVFMGNVDVQSGLPTEDFSQAVPEFMSDSAFVDRIHGLIPGWELPKIMQVDRHLSRRYGLATDYFCEVLHELRKMDFQHYISSRVALSENVTIRDERGIKKIASAMLKILCPNAIFTDQELRIAMDTAVEYRQRIADWLHKLAPGEFPEKQLNYHLRD